MSRKIEMQMADLITDRNACIKMMSPSWQLHYANNEHAPLSTYIETLHAQIKRLQNKEAK